MVLQVSDIVDRRKQLIGHLVGGELPLKINPYAECSICSLEYFLFKLRGIGSSHFPYRCIDPHYAPANVIFHRLNHRLAVTHGISRGQRQSAACYCWAEVDTRRQARTFYRHFG